MFLPPVYKRDEKKKAWWSSSDVDAEWAAFEM